MKKQIIKAFELPEDIFFDLPVITLYGENRLIVENHHGIIDYSTSRISLLTHVCIYVIEGIALDVIYYGKDTIEIVGQIHQIRVMHA